MLHNSKRRTARTLVAFLLWNWCAQLSPPARAQESSAEEVEIDQLQVLLLAENDPDKKTEIYRQISDLSLRSSSRKTSDLYKAWQEAGDGNVKRKLGRELAEAAVLSNQPELVMEVATGGTFQEKQIHISQAAQPVLLREGPLLSSATGEGEASAPDRWVIRRMTADRIEVWQPHHGWLFDSQGQLLNEASPPRRDGTGREWYGAFLPDGSWVTTDLWDQDKVLTFFSREGKWLMEINAADLVPHKEGDDGQYYTAISTIGWCRCDAVGNGFVVSVGQGGGRGVAWVNSNGEHQILEDRAAPWKLCYPRDLERKGMYTHLYIPSDQGDRWFESRTPGHGSFCDYPTLEAPDLTVMIPDGEKFGFWPGSSSLWMGTKLEGLAPDDEMDSPSNSPNEQTLFYEANGHFNGWIAARRLTDTAALDGMVFCDGKNRVISLGRDRRIQKIEQFTWPDGSVASPYKLFSELQLGFFTKEGNLVLARW